MADGVSRPAAAARALAWIVAAYLLSEAAWALHGARAVDQTLPPWLPHRLFTTLTALGLSWLFLRSEGRTLASLGLRLDRRWAAQFGTGMALGAGIILAAALACAALAGVRWRPGAGGLGAVAAGAWLYLAVAWAEELHYRGYPFQRLGDALGRWPAQALFAAWFVFGHWHNPGMAGSTRLWAALNIGLAAILLGYAWMRTGSLAMSVGIHLAWNLVQGPLLGFGVSGTQGPSVLVPDLPAAGLWLHGGSFGLEAGLPCALACVAALLGLHRWKPAAAPAEPPDRAQRRPLSAMPPR